VPPTSTAFDRLKYHTENGRCEEGSTEEEEGSKRDREQNTLNNFFLRKD
jgi:hypothetical protein